VKALIVKSAPVAPVGLCVVGEGVPGWGVSGEGPLVGVGVSGAGPLVGGGVENGGPVNIAVHPGVTPAVPRTRRAAAP
jgi:hypothetical protein